MADPDRFHPALDSSATVRGAPSDALCGRSARVAAASPLATPDARMLHPATAAECHVGSLACMPAQTSLAVPCAPLAGATVDELLGVCPTALSHSTQPACVAPLRPCRLITQSSVGA